MNEPANPIDRKFRKRIALKTDDAKNTKREWEQAKNDNPHSKRHRQLDDGNTRQQNEHASFNRIACSNHAAK